MSGSEAKDLAYYEGRPDELGELSIEQIDALYANANLGEGDTGAKPESGKAPEAAPEGKKPEVKEEGLETPPAGNTGEETLPPEGVATKDGKHIIPFEVLEKERSRAADLERIALEQAAQIEALKAQATGKPDGGKPEGQDVTVLSEDELAELEKELPAIGKLFRAQQAQMKILADTVTNLNAERQNREEEGRRTVQQTVQEAIDANPKLAYLQAQDPNVWERAVRFDATLRGDPDWAAKSFGDRFDKVVQLYEATYGEVKLPGQAAATKLQPSQEELAKQADAKLAAVKPRGPASMSDIPGGSIPPTDEIARLESMSTAELGAMFESMTEQQQADYLARLG